jgi:hypothetical protein
MLRGCLETRRGVGNHLLTTDSYSSAFASLRSGVSKPSVKQPYGEKHRPAAAKMHAIFSVV